LSTESEVILARYKAIEKTADALGRIIGVRRLKPSEQTKVAAFCADLTGYDEMTGPNGEKVQIPHRMPLVVAAAVCMIGDSMIPFPRSRAELDSIYDRLDVEGISAAGEALAKLNSGAPEADPVDLAKN
jgi:hypothetical protein